MKIAIGTVQFGKRYGILNKKKPNDKTIKSILNYAQNSNIDTIDTAFNYGDAEKKLGLFFPKKNTFKVVTKTPVFFSSKYEDISEYFNDAFNSSYFKLNKKVIYGLLIHHPFDMLSDYSNIIWDEMINLNEKGLVKKIGVSVNTPQQLDEILKKRNVQIVQLPLSILDQTFIKSGHLKLLHEMNIEVHVRSVLCQGLLANTNFNLHKKLRFLEKKLYEIRSFTKDKNISLLNLSLNFVLNLKEVRKIVIGIQSLQQLKQIIDTTKCSNENLDLDIINNFALEQKNFNKVYELMSTL